MRKNFYVLAGLPGIGESTTAKQLYNEGVIIISTDKLRRALNQDHYPSGKRYQILDEMIWPLVDNLVIQYLNTGFDIAIDSTNLSLESRRHWSDIVFSHSPGYSYKILWHEGNWDSFERWNKHRGTSKEEYDRIISKLNGHIEFPKKEECDQLIFINSNKSANEGKRLKMV